MKRLLAIAIASLLFSSAYAQDDLKLKKNELNIPPDSFYRPPNSFMGQLKLKKCYMVGSRESSERIAVEGNQGMYARQAVRVLVQCRNKQNEIIMSPSLATYPDMWTESAPGIFPAIRSIVHVQNPETGFPYAVYADTSSPQKEKGYTMSMSAMCCRYK